MPLLIKDSLVTCVIVYTPQKDKTLLTLGALGAHMRSKGYGSRSVCLFVCLSVYDYSRTTGYEAAYERYQHLQCYKGMKNNVAILLKRLRSKDMA